MTRQTSEKVAYKPGLDNLLECFFPSSFSRKVFKISPSPPPAKKFWPEPMTSAIPVQCSGGLGFKSHSGLYFFLGLISQVLTLSCMYSCKDQSYLPIPLLSHEFYPSTRTQQAEFFRFYMYMSEYPTFPILTVAFFFMC